MKLLGFPDVLGVYERIYKYQPFFKLGHCKRVVKM